MNRNLYVVLPLFTAAMLVSARLAIAWPYIENWPYTGLAYAVLFSLLAFTVALRMKHHIIRTDSPLTWSKVGGSLILFFCVGSAFWSSSLRFLTEPGISYAFGRATVTEKLRSSNHNYPCLRLLTDTGHEITLNIPGQERVWQRVHRGSTVKKHFGNEKILILSETGEAEQGDGH